MTQDRSRRYRTGLYGEMLAAWYLRFKGYKIVARRMKTPVGEVDLVARRGSVLAFIEVKTRASVAEALVSVGSVQQQRIVRAAGYYLSGHPGPGCDVRFDVIAVQPPLRLIHIPAAFTA